MGLINNIGKADYKYKGSKITKIAEAKINIIENVLEFKKEFVPNFGVSGDKTQIKLTLFLPSSILTPITNLVVTDVLPVGLTFVNGTVAIDGINVPNGNPAIGINVGTLNPSQTKVVTFDATVD